MKGVNRQMRRSQLDVPSVVAPQTCQLRLPHLIFIADAITNKGLTPFQYSTREVGEICFIFSDESVKDRRIFEECFSVRRLSCVAYMFLYSSVLRNSMCKSE